MRACAPRITVAYLAPYGRHHEVASVVAVVDQTEEFPISHVILSGFIGSKQGSSRESSLGHLDPRTVEILLQTGIELSQPAILEVGHTLLLVLDITPRAKFVSGHCDG